MAALKCLACGQENKVGEESCTACSSSLNLKLCSSCEAVNGHTAERCHNCGAGFGPDRPRAGAVVRDPVLVIEQGPAGKSLPAIQQRNAQASTARTRRGRRAAVFWTLGIALATGGAYAYYELPGVPVAKGFIASAITPKSTPAPVVAPGPGFIRPPEGPAAEKPPQSPPKTAKAPAATTTPETSSPPPAPRRAQVTHTKAPEPGEAAAVAASAPAVSQAPIKKEMNPSADCPPGVAALGLCISK